MRAVWKYTMPAIPTTMDIEMPWQSEVLSVQAHQVSGRECIAIWVLVDTNHALLHRRFHVAGTGHSLSKGERADTHLATVQTSSGQYVWHVFDGGWQSFPDNIQHTTTHAR